MKNLAIALLFSLITFNIQAQDCSGPEHSVNIHDSWNSCTETVNPNIDRGVSHWIMYDLGYVYKIGSTHFWNYNVTGETDKGMKTIVLDVSEDGVNWIQMSMFELSEASGEASYQGTSGPDLGGISCRYLLISAIDTWGNPCAGLSEIRLDIVEVVNVNEDEAIIDEIELFPNPALDILELKTAHFFEGLIIINSNGKEVYRGAFKKVLDVSYLPNGLYFLRMNGPDQQRITKKFIKYQP